MELGSMPASLAKHLKKKFLKRGLLAFGMILESFGSKKFEISTGKVRPLTLTGTQHKNEASQHAS